MNPEQLWKTTMNPLSRRLVKVTPDEAERTEQFFNMLLGDNLQGRKNYIEENGYKYMELIDVQ